MIWGYTDDELRRAGDERLSAYGPKRSPVPGRRTLKAASPGTLAIRYDTDRVRNPAYFIVDENAKVVAGGYFKRTKKRTKRRMRALEKHANRDLEALRAARAPIRFPDETEAIVDYERYERYSNDG